METYNLNIKVNQTQFNELLVRAKEYYLAGSASSPERFGDLRLINNYLNDLMIDIWGDIAQEEEL